ncbi:hypothetical protein [Pseudomonas citrulli]|uniref:Uncharacterized protein n=1 Tax=Pseudomonas citrulli TaxID=3064347 RepID=A0ABT9BW81_9PSED|nr:hypothetical protein [Pseudomonas sp. K18]MDO7896441.1 hypothetical protein [Pseudomonas sp. K18]
MAAQKNNSENLIVNGTFDTSLEGWSSNQVTWVSGRARLAPAARLSQTVGLSAPGVVKLLFNVSSYYGVGGVRLSSGDGYCTINRAGEYEVDFTIDNGGSVDLIFTSQGAYDVDNVELRFAEAECTPVQLLQNGNFDNALEGWDYDGEVKIVDGQAHMSERSRLFQEIAVKPGTPIRVNYTYKTSNPVGFSCTILEYGPRWNSVAPDWISAHQTFVAPEGVAPSLVHLEFRLHAAPSGPPFFAYLHNLEVWACPGEAGMTKTRHDLWSIP